MSDAKVGGMRHPSADEWAAVLAEVGDVPEVAGVPLRQSVTSKAHQDVSHSLALIRARRGGFEDARGRAFEALLSAARAVSDFQAVAKSLEAAARAIAKMEPGE